MALQDPVAVYTAVTNTEAELVRHALAQSGIEAHITEDLSVVGLWMGGTVPGIHTPKVWVDRTDLERAVSLLQAYDERKAQEGAFGLEKEPADSATLEAVCEECGQRSTFPAEQRGSVQECPACGSYLDVGADEGPGPWEEDEAEAADDDTEPEAPSS